MALGVDPSSPREQGAHVGTWVKRLCNIVVVYNVGVEVRGQLCSIHSLLLPSHRLQASNPGLQASRAISFTHSLCKGFHKHSSI